MVECIIWKILLATQNLKQKQLRNLTTQLNLLTFHCLSIELLCFNNLFSMFWIIKANDSCSFSNNWCFLMKNIFKSLNQLVDHLLFSSLYAMEFIANFNQKCKWSGPLCFMQTSLIFAQCAHAKRSPSCLSTRGWVIGLYYTCKQLGIIESHSNSGESKEKPYLSNNM